MESKWRYSWWFALGAGWSGVLLLAVHHFWIGSPKWVQILNGSSGWTIYPPLSALPQAIPGEQEFLGFLTGAVVCGLLFLGAWLRSFAQLRQQPNAGDRRWFWLSLLLLVPVVIHLGGTLYAAYVERKAMNELVKDYLQQQVQEKQAESLKADSLDDMLDSEE